MVDLIGWLFGFLSTHPSGLLATLLFVFAVSVVGNLIPFFPTPYLVIVIGLVLDESYIGIIQIAAIAALGAASGKLVSYALGYGARRAIRKQERFDSLRKLMGGSTFLVGVLFAASPLVDAAFIPMGMKAASTSGEAAKRTPTRKVLPPMSFRRESNLSCLRIARRAPYPRA